MGNVTAGQNGSGARLSTGERVVPISADSHIVEPDNCYRDHIEKKYRDTAPRIEREDRNGVPTDVFVIDGFLDRVPVMGVASAGRDPKETFLSGTVADAPQGGWDPKVRIEHQERDGIAAEILYPSMGMMICSHPDPDYKEACLGAYNRWLEEYVSENPKRLLGIGQTSSRSVAGVVKDLEKIKAVGFKGIMLPGYPDTEFDYCDPSYDALWEASIALDMPICFHILTTAHKKKAGELFFTQPEKRGNSRMNAFHGIIRGVQDILGMFVFDGILERHPKLKVVCTEADAGWVPHFMARMDHAYHRFAGTLKGVELSKLPSEFFKENFYVTFQDDWVAFQMTHLMNPKRLMWANDYPHGDSTWPNSQPLLNAHTAHLGDDEKRWILRENVAELYKLDTTGMKAVA